MGIKEYPAPIAEFVSKETAYWIDRKEASEAVVKQHEKDLKEIPLHMMFHKAIIELCEAKIKAAEPPGQDKE